MTPIIDSPAIATKLITDDQNITTGLDQRSFPVVVDPMLGHY